MLKIEQKETPEEIAQLIEFAKIYLLQIDVTALGILVKKMREQASIQDSTVILSRNPQLQTHKNDILSHQAQAVDFLHKFLLKLIEIQGLKDKLSETESIYDLIQKQFL